MAKSVIFCLLSLYLSAAKYLETVFYEGRGKILKTVSKYLDTCEGRVGLHSGQDLGRHLIQRHRPQISHEPVRRERERERQRERVEERDRERERKGGERKKGVRETRRERDKERERERESLTSANVDLRTRCVCVYVCVHASWVRACVNAYVNVCTRSRAHVHVHTCVCICVCAYVRMYMFVRSCFSFSPPARIARDLPSAPAGPTFVCFSTSLSLALPPLSLPLSHTSPASPGNYYQPPQA